ncbi:armadillo repeat-containing protein [Reticulomyxa filosa]|uniref:Armadillo repeat-containing protein n=1 Tax=Reticulomyxa filosa TaxID=46433 RepID=X6MMT5_RETFI|nr:armadillo repeat-containing protein [Reticulomyxa filosa]|eukprot:ETO14370.1 armadillo repeat-containing protein [Reticulomyxa filosa]
MSDDTVKTCSIPLESVEIETAPYQHKWTELPMDQLQLPLGQLRCFKKRANDNVLIKEEQFEEEREEQEQEEEEEQGQEDEHNNADDMNYEEITNVNANTNANANGLFFESNETSLNSVTILLELFDKDKELWPVGAKFHPGTDMVANINELKIGDIVHACDYKSQWFTGYIRMINYMSKQVCVHWLFWDRKWDEWVSLDRLQSVNNNMLHYHLPFSNMFALEAYQINTYNSIPLRKVFGCKDISNLLTQVAQEFKFPVLSTSHMNWYSNDADDDDDDNNDDNNDDDDNDDDGDDDLENNCYDHGHSLRNVRLGAKRGNRMLEARHNPMKQNGSFCQYVNLLEYYKSLKEYVSSQIAQYEIEHMNSEQKIDFQIQKLRKDLEDLENSLQLTKSISQKQNEMKQDIDNLSTSFQQWFQELEAGFLEWNTAQVVDWIRCIFFNSTVFSSSSSSSSNDNSDPNSCNASTVTENNSKIMQLLLDHIEKQKTTGIDLLSFNPLYLRIVLGIRNTEVQQLILSHIDRLQKIHANSTKKVSECPICCGADTSKGLVPCGHVGFCSQCAEHFLHTKCPICRATVQSVITTYYVNSLLG